MKELSDLACKAYFYIFHVADENIKPGIAFADMVDLLCGALLVQDREEIISALQELINRGVLKCEAVKD
mgnify:CR=1 FL=1